jgi:aminoglycoside 3-N-acetyltransferase
MAETAPPSPGGTRQTRQSIARELRGLGVSAGQILLVHASLSSLGYVQGGAAAVTAALRDVLGPEGTLAVSAATASNSDTSRTYLARTAGMTAQQVRDYKAAMPPFDPSTTPSDGAGRIAEHIRTVPGAARSGHPQSSFAAVGPMAGKLTDGHALDCHLGEKSPLGRMYETSAWVLMLGVGYLAFSAFHLAEYRYVPDPPMRRYWCVVKQNGRAAGFEYQDVVLDDQDFEPLGADLDESGLAVRGTVGRAQCRLVPMVPAVDFAAGWLRRRRCGPRPLRPVPDSSQVTPAP